MTLSPKECVTFTDDCSIYQYDDFFQDRKEEMKQAIKETMPEDAKQAMPEESFFTLFSASAFPSDES